MTEHNRRISARLATTLAIVSLSLALPAATLAGHQDVGARHHDGRHHPSQRVEHRRGYGRYDRHDRHRPQRGFGYWWGNHHRPRPYRVHLHGSSCGHRQSSYGYYCRPCGQRYGSFDRLSHHVHQVHHIPFWKLPFVIFAKAMGHYYYG